MSRINEEATYEQIGKNTVKATNQLKESAFVSFENPEGKGIRVLFVGNSITRHGIAQDIGWHNDWGMAASSKDKDYVHRLIAKMDNVQNDAAYCICQVAAWERGYKEGMEKFYEVYRSAHDFDADIIILRFIENCSFDGWDPEIFKSELEKLLAYLNPSGNAKAVITTGFWHHCGDETIREFAREHDMPLAELGDLGEMDEMKAVGFFEHEGVANHPGDLGMEKIAERIWAKIVKALE
ncbi:MAG: SGNH/GDSL hydrolase family protein, partial [Roseburia sp.]|nr:SGNH/GDSL hydrolase family protein [Roseburia sp.]